MFMESLRECLGRRDRMWETFEPILPNRSQSFSQIASFPFYENEAFIIVFTKAYH
jgi:hypothetical protein